MYVTNTKDVDEKDPVFARTAQRPQYTAPALSPAPHKHATTLPGMSTHTVF